MDRRRTVKLVAVATGLILASGVVAYAVVGPTLPANDLEALLALGNQAQTKEAKTMRGPKLRPAPRARCGRGSRPLRGMQGRVTQQAIDSATAERGWTCNLRRVSRFSTPGGFRVWRYRDRAGRVCSYYDTSLSSPLNIATLLGGPSPGVEVLDMSHPSHPVETDVLKTFAMLAPHESLNLNRRRGLLAAEVGNGLTLPGLMAVYSVSADCRHPVLRAQMATITGHESGFSPDGKTFWIAGGAGYINAVDLTRPASPRVIWKGAYYSHGLELSRNGKRLYQTDPINGNLGIFDVSEIQEREPSPKVHELRRVTWKTVSIPQNSIRVQIRRKPYLIEFDEFAFRFNPPTVADRAGAARLISLRHPKRPRTVSNLRLKVNMAKVHRRVNGDPNPIGPAQVTGYGAHYCAVPRRVNPKLVACSFLNSGLRVFDIRKPRRPREIAYFVAPPKDGTVAGFQPGNAALSQPAFDRTRHDVWYTDAGSGFYNLHLTRRAWPKGL